MMWGWARPSRVSLLLLLALLLCLAGCTSGGDQGQATAPSAPSPAVERQALANLLALYQEAVVAEDSDRLQALLAPAAALAPGPDHRRPSAPRQDPHGGLCRPGRLPGDHAQHLSAGHCHGPRHPARDRGPCPGPEQRHVPGGRKHPRPGDAGAAHAGVSHHLGAQPRGHRRGARGNQRGPPPGAAGRGHDRGLAGGGATAAAHRAGPDRGLCPGGGGGARAGSGAVQRLAATRGQVQETFTASGGHGAARPAGAGPGHATARRSSLRTATACTRCARASRNAWWGPGRRGCWP